VVLHRVCPKHLSLGYALPCVTYPRSNLVILRLPSSVCFCYSFLFCLRLDLFTFIPVCLLISLVSTAGSHTRSPFLRHLSMTFYLSSYYLFWQSRASRFVVFTLFRTSGVVHPAFIPPGCFLGVGDSLPSYHFYRSWN
jgi:hypothetical protein